MPTVEQLAVTTSTGIGKPDYSRYVSQAITRAGYRLGYNQRLKLFSLVFSETASDYPFISEPLAPDTPTYMIDTETGLAMPFHVDQGYTFEVTAFLSKFAEDVMHELNLDGEYGGFFNLLHGGMSLYHNEVFSVTTAFWDPTAASAHDWGVYVTNIGTIDMIGGSSLWCFVTALGTKPFPDKKTVRCKFCGHQWEEPWSTVKVNCPACGELNCYFNLSQLRGMP